MANTYILKVITDNGAVHTLKTITAETEDNARVRASSIHKYSKWRDCTLVLLDGKGEVLARKRPLKGKTRSAWLAATTEAKPDKNDVRVDLQSYYALERTSGCDTPLYRQEIKCSTLQEAEYRAGILQLNKKYVGTTLYIEDASRRVIAKRKPSDWVHYLKPVTHTHAFFETTPQSGNGTNDHNSIGLFKKLLIKLFGVR